jgi:8-oxo-dGTP pyrophosphatase MutT (NUDIX family)
MPLLASTVVLVRGVESGGFEVFMNRRPDNMETYAGVYVFPGGCVEKDDFSTEMLALTQGLEPAEAQAALESDLAAEACLGHWVAAARELFEEAGVHFFVSTRAQDVDEMDLGRRLAAKREALQQGELSLSSLLGAEGLACDLGRLRYFFHRTTPEHYKIRFDTRFYLASLPKNQTPLPTSEEVAESLWITPEAALAESESGRFPMMPPTITVLRTLAHYPAWSELCAFYRLWKVDISR